MPMCRASIEYLEKHTTNFSYVQNCQRKKTFLFATNRYELILLLCCGTNLLGKVLKMVKSQ